MTRKMILLDFACHGCEWVEWVSWVSELSEACKHVSEPKYHCKQEEWQILSGVSWMPHLSLLWVRSMARWQTLAPHKYHFMPEFEWCGLNGCNTKLHWMKNCPNKLSTSWVFLCSYQNEWEIVLQHLYVRIYYYIQDTY
jgi:hypothetical protein